MFDFLTNLAGANLNNENKCSEGRGTYFCGYTGFPKKDARFSKIKNIPDQLSDDKEGKIM